MTTDSDRDPARYVVLGAGAVGGTLAAALHRSGRPTVVVARGEHLRRIQGDGLLVRTVTGDITVNVPAVGSVWEASITARDVVIVATKSEDSLPALEEVAQAATSDVRVVCAQNGVETERRALRYFESVYALMIVMHSVHLTPGVIEVRVGPRWAIADIGRYPDGVDEAAERIAADLQDSGILSRPVDRIMDFKYQKLLLNLGNALDVMVGPDPSAAPLLRQAQEEALAVFRTAGISTATKDEFSRRRSQLVDQGPAPAATTYIGSSTWQSVARGKARIEVAYLNGEIVLLGRIHGVATPVNRFLMEAADRFARSGMPAGSLPAADLLEAYRAGQPSMIVN